MLVPLAVGLLLCSTVLSTLGTSITGSIFVLSGCQLVPPSHGGKSLVGRPARGLGDLNPEDIQYASFENGQMKQVSTDDNDMDDLEGFERFAEETAAAAAENPTLQVATKTEEIPAKTYLGVIKSFAQAKGYGFIKCQATFEVYKADVFLHKNDARLLGKVSAGTPVRFAVRLNSNGQPQARDVSLHNTGETAPDNTVTAGSTSRNNDMDAARVDWDRVFTGRVKKYDATAGFGFLDCAATQRLFGRDVFLHKNQAEEAGSPRAGEFVKFCVEVNSKGQPQARNLTKFEPLLPNSAKPTETGESVPADRAV